MTKPIIEIELDEHGRGSVKVDGHDLAYATKSVAIQTEAGKPSTATLVLWAHDLAIKLPAHVIADVQEAITYQMVLDEAVHRVSAIIEADGLENRIVERVLAALNQSVGVRR